MSNENLWKVHKEEILKIWAEAKAKAAVLKTKLEELKITQKELSNLSDTIDCLFGDQNDSWDFSGIDDLGNSISSIEDHISDIESECDTIVESYDTIVREIQDKEEELY
jgi:hypothetical protein